MLSAISFYQLGMKLSVTQSQPAHRLVLMQLSKRRNGKMDWKSEEKICNDENYTK